VSGAVNLICQRCLTALNFEIDSKSLLVLAKDEAQADTIEELLDDDEIDVIVGSAAFDVNYLIEDDALLACRWHPSMMSVLTVVWRPRPKVLNGLPRLRY
jgi:uncharacterized metal-binding protein YceD (DUF177 family)